MGLSACPSATLLAVMKTLVYAMQKEVQVSNATYPAPPAAAGLRTLSQPTHPLLPFGIPMHINFGRLQFTQGACYVASVLHRFDHHHAAACCDLLPLA